MTQVCNMISRCLIIGLEFPTKVTAVRKGSPFAQLIETVRWTLLIQAKLFFFLNFSLPYTKQSLQNPYKAFTASNHQTSDSFPRKLGGLIKLKGTCYYPPPKSGKMSGVWFMLVKSEVFANTPDLDNHETKDSHIC